MKNVSSIKIVIPSYKRAGVNPSIDNLPDDIVSKYVTLAVRDEEYDEYLKAHPGVNIHNLGKDIDGIVETRQRINEQFNGKIIVIDDDNIFFHVRHGAHKKDPTNKYIGRGQRLESSEEYVEMLKYCSTLLDTFEYGTMRNLNFLRDPRWYPYTLNSICYWVHFFNLDTFDYVNCNFRNGPKSGLCEDLYLPIDWFDKGNDFFTLVKYNVGETTGQNQMDGGCNTSDRGIRYKESLEQLHEMFPQYSKLKESKKNTETYGFEIPTLIIRLNTKKRKYDKATLPL